ncbi:MAG: hypothetical protein RJA63_574 [Pseudomonadota bacterium]
MSRLDWSAMLAPDKPTESKPSVVCCPKSVETEQRVETLQVIDNKYKTDVCCHVSTVSTKREWKGGSRALNANLQPGGEWYEGARAYSSNPARILTRPSLNYRLHGTGTGGTVIGDPVDTLGDLLDDLVSRYGSRLDLESVKEAFHERAAIMEFDAGLPRAEAERAARTDVVRGLEKAGGP